VGVCRSGQHNGPRVHPRSCDDVDHPLRSIPASRQAPSEARRHVADACAGWPPARLRIAHLLTTEVVTNAVVHGRGDVGLRILGDPQVLRVEVSDNSPELPRVRPLGAPTQRGGRGLHIVTAMATDWGVRSRGDAGGKTVWFELRRTLT
jgi:anti-sigma regulatory factor (Ser/Thr protein kinase)